MRKEKIFGRQHSTASLSSSLLSKLLHDRRGRLLKRRFGLYGLVVDDGPLLLDGLREGADPAPAPARRHRAVGGRRHLFQDVARKSERDSEHYFLTALYLKWLWCTLFVLIYKGIYNLDLSSLQGTFSQDTCFHSYNMFWKRWREGVRLVGSHSSHSVRKKGSCSLTSRRPSATVHLFIPDHSN